MVLEIFWSRYPNWSAINLSNFTSIGLDSTQFIPDNMDLLTYSCSQCPVTAEMIGCAKPTSSRKVLICMVDSYPSMMGMLQSISMRSKLQNLPLFSLQSSITFQRASQPFIADTMRSEFVMPMEYFKITVKASRLNDWSSTIRIFLGFITQQESIISITSGSVFFLFTRGISTELSQCTA